MMLTINTLSKSLVVIATSALLSGCGLHGKPAVERKNAETRDGARTDVVAPGIVEPWGGQVELAAQEPGWIARIDVNEGDVVRQGQLLGSLEDAAQRRTVDLARAELDEAEAVLARTEKGATVEELRSAQAEFDAAAARSIFARASATRSDRLHTESSVTDNDAERATSDALEQAALAERAAARLQEIRRGARIEDRNAVRARSAGARARLRVAEAGLERRQITAPRSGTVLLSRFHPGEFYSAAAGSLFVLGDLSRLQVRLEVDEIDALDVQGGVPCTIHSDGGVRLAQGAVVRLAPKMGRRALPLESPTARTDVRIREVFIEVPASARLVPGQRVWGHASRIATRTP